MHGVPVTTAPLRMVGESANQYGAFQMPRLEALGDMLDTSGLSWGLSPLLMALCLFARSGGEGSKESQAR